MSEFTYSARVAVRLKTGVNDPQGVTVLGSLHDMGYRSIRDVRVGKLIDITLAANGEREARDQLEAICRDLLVNPVIEDYQIDLDTSTGIEK